MFSEAFLDESQFQTPQVICSGGHTMVLNFNDFLNSSKLWQSCPVCFSPDAFICKVVPRKLLLILLIPTLMVAFFALAWNWWVGMAILFASALVDLALYKFLPNMLVCYGCESEFRSISQEVQVHFKPFDHHTAEKHRQRK